MGSKAMNIGMKGLVYFTDTDKYLEIHDEAGFEEELKRRVTNCRSSLQSVR